MFLFIFFFKQKTAYEMRISDWSSDVCSSDLPFPHPGRAPNLSSDHKTNGGCRQRNRASHFPSVRRPCPALRRRSWAPSCWVSPACRYPAPAVAREIGRAPCRERVCQYVYISVVAVSFKKQPQSILIEI